MQADRFCTRKNLIGHTRWNATGNTLDSSPAISQLSERSRWRDSQPFHNVSKKRIDVNVCLSVRVRPPDTFLIVSSFFARATSLKCRTQVRRDFNMEVLHAHIFINMNILPGTKMDTATVHTMLSCALCFHGLFFGSCLQVASLLIV